jgi:hypothetical protein
MSQFFLKWIKLNNLKIQKWKKGCLVLEIFRPWARGQGPRVKNLERLKNLK